MISAQGGYIYCYLCNVNVHSFIDFLINYFILKQKIIVQVSCAAVSRNQNDAWKKIF